MSSRSVARVHAYCHGAERRTDPRALSKSQNPADAPVKLFLRTAGRCHVARSLSHRDFYYLMRPSPGNGNTGTRERRERSIPCPFSMGVPHKSRHNNRRRVLTFPVSLRRSHAITHNPGSELLNCRCLISLFFMGYSGKLNRDLPPVMHVSWRLFLPTNVFCFHLFCSRLNVMKNALIEDPFWWLSQEQTASSDNHRNESKMQEWTLCRSAWDNNFFS